MRDDLAHYSECEAIAATAPALVRLLLGRQLSATEAVSAQRLGRLALGLGDTGAVAGAVLFVAYHTVKDTDEEKARRGQEHEYDLEPGTAELKEQRLEKLVAEMIHNVRQHVREIDKARASRSAGPTFEATLSAPSAAALASG